MNAADIEKIRRVLTNHPQIEMRFLYHEENFESEREFWGQHIDETIDILESMVVALKAYKLSDDLEDFASFMDMENALGGLTFDAVFYKREGKSQ